MAKKNMVDIAPLVSKLKRIPGAFKKVVEPLVMQEGRLFVRDVVKYTPPAGPGVTGLAAKKRGEARVAGDIAKIYGTAAKVYIDLALRNKPLAQAFWKAINDGDFQRAKELMKDSGASRYRNASSIAPFDGGTMHQRFRKRGRVQRDQVTMIVTDTKQLQAYVKKMQGRVGMLAAGWMRAARKLGQPLPAWVSRHGDRRGACVILKREDAVVIVFSNRVKFAGLQDMQRRAEYVLGYRERALAKRMPYIIRAALRDAGMGH